MLHVVHVHPAALERRLQVHTGRLAMAHDGRRSMEAKQ